MASKCPQFKISQHYPKASLGTSLRSSKSARRVVDVLKDGRVFAEDEETPEELQFLHALECDEARGFHFSPPVRQGIPAAP
jgi:EAL domain-containing protein (putative c-di-GMP-specific phosphodiesterase class I)